MLTPEQKTGHLQYKQENFNHAKRKSIILRLLRVMKHGSTIMILRPNKTPCNESTKGQQLWDTEGVLLLELGLHKRTLLETHAAMKALHETIKETCHGKRWQVCCCFMTMRQLTSCYQGMLLSDPPKSKGGARFINSQTTRSRQSNSTQYRGGTTDRPIILELLISIGVSSISRLMQRLQASRGLAKVKDPKVCHSFVLMAPNILHTGNDEKIIVQCHECAYEKDLPVDITVNNFPKDDQRLDKTDTHLRASNNYLATANIKIPYSYLSTDRNEKQFVIVRASSAPSVKSSLQFVIEKVILVSPHTGYIFIQTDKTIYTPNQNVNYRIFSTDQNLNPAEREVIVLFQNPNGIIVHREEKRILKGLTGLNLKIPEPITFGTWKIIAKFSHAQQKEYMTQFEVQEYVLPTFNVELETKKKFFYYKDEQLVVNIKATYLFGQNVNGYAVVIFVLYKDTLKTLHGSMKRVEINDGEGSVELKREQLLEAVSNENELIGHYIYANVTVFSTDGDYVTAHKTNIKIVSSPYNIAVTRTPPYFKPGLPFKLTVSVKNPDMTPAAGVIVACGEIRGRTSEEGLAYLPINTQISLKELTLTVKTAVEGLQEKQQANVTMTAKPYNPMWNQNFLYIEPTLSNDEVNINLHIKSEDKIAENIKYFTILRLQILCREWFFMLLDKLHDIALVYLQTHRLANLAKCVMNLSAAFVSALDASPCLTTESENIARALVLMIASVTVSPASSFSLIHISNNLSISSCTDVLSWDNTVVPFAGLALLMMSFCFRIAQIVEVLCSYIRASSITRVPFSCNFISSCFISMDIILFFLSALTFFLGPMMQKKMADITGCKGILGQILSRGKILQTIFQKRSGTEQISAVRFYVTPDMLPSFRIVAYYYVFLSGGMLELVSDSVWLNLKRTCKGSLKINPSKRPANFYRPQEKVELQLTGDKGAYVGLVAVDKAVFVLNNKSRLTQDKIWDDVQQNDIGCTAGGGANPLGVFQDAGLDFTTNIEKIHTLPRSADDTEEDLEEDSAPRSKFPESWRWNLLELKSDLKDNTVTVPLDLNLPDSITTWIIQAISIKEDKVSSYSPDEPCETRRECTIGLTNAALLVYSSHLLDNGICVSEPYQLTTFKEFFIDLRMPYSVIKNEQVQIRAVIHNYTPSQAVARVKFFYNENICSLATKSRGYQETVKIPAQSSKVVYYVVIPLKATEVHIDVLATVSSSGLSDRVSKVLYVLPEGKLMRKQAFSETINPEGRLQQIHIKTEALEGMVPDSIATNFISIQGDIMGETLLGILDDSYLGSLIYVPYGCPEQNMIHTTPNVIVTKYLDVTKRWDAVGAEKRSKAISNIKKGYLTQLSHLSGDSFQGSTWLTAYVVKIFSMALKANLVYVDKNMLCKSSMWLVKNQQNNGKFKEPGTVYAKSMQGGYAESESSLTAFVLIALAELENTCNQIEIEKAIEKAEKYLEDELPKLKHTYSAAITSYALSLLGNTKNIGIIDSFANKDRTFWPVDNPLNGYFTVEATGYALLQKLKLKKFEEAHKIAEWLVKVRSFGGGYRSTQATVIALQALAQYQIDTKSPQIVNLDVQLVIEGKDRPLEYTIRNNDAYLERTSKVMTVYQALLNAKNQCNGFTLGAEVKPHGKLWGNNFPIGR
ncbi:complement C3-like [Leptodactylus fuscus]